MGKSGCGEGRGYGKGSVWRGEERVWRGGEGIVRT